MLLCVFKLIICMCDIALVTLIATYMNSEDGKNLEKPECITLWIVMALIVINVLLILM